MKLIKETLEEIGYKNTYDLEIDDKNHNFLLEGNIVTSNSHSFCYALNAYISMWLKVHYPIEYYTTLLNNSNKDDIAMFIKESTGRNIHFHDFKCNESDKIFSVDYNENKIRMSLETVKGLNKKDIEKLTNGIKINSFEELLEFTKKEKLGKRAIEALSRLGYFNRLFENRKGLEVLLLRYRNLKVKEKDLIPQLIEEAKNTEDYSVAEQLAFEREYLGFYISEHPFTTGIEKIKSKDPNLLKQLIFPSQAEALERESFILAGVINDLVVKKTKSSQKEYLVMKLEDTTKQVNVKVWDFNALPANTSKGAFIFLNVSKSVFGLAKERKTMAFILK